MKIQAAFLLLALILPFTSTSAPTRAPTRAPTPHPTQYVPSVIAAGEPVGDWPMLTVPVMFHVHHMLDGTGNVSLARLTENINQLNRAFSAQEARQADYAKATDAKIRFKLHAVMYVANDTWHNLCALTSTVSAVRPAVQLPPARYLNIYICHNSANLGLSWLPYVQWFKDYTDENHYAMSVIIHHELVSINNVFKGRWSQGDIMTHEAGHFFGLKHTYESGCWGTEANSDYLGGLGFAFFVCLIDQSTDRRCILLLLLQYGYVRGHPEDLR